MSQQYGTNLPPVSFPGIASGIDYNSIITKLVNLQTAQNVPFQNDLTALSSANTELIKINGLLASVQNTLTTLSDPNVFGAVTATSSNTAALSAVGLSGYTATPGTYNITATTAATPTVIIGSATKGHSITDNIGGVPSDTKNFIDSYAEIRPTNGAGGGSGKVTIDGVSVNYDVGSQSLQQILLNIAVAVTAVDPSFTIGYSAPGSGIIKITSSNPISLGSSSDTGNLLTALKLDTAFINEVGPTKSVVGTANVGGISLSDTLNSVNTVGDAKNANFVTPVTSGSFTINGVNIAVDITKDNLNNIINRINTSSAGVTAAFNQSTGQFSLVAKATGPSSVVLSAGSSNFLTAVGITGPGSTTTLGSQSSITVSGPTGTSTLFGNSNTYSNNAIPGLSVTVTATTSTPFTLTVAQDTSKVAGALSSFITAYNATITEINNATAAPTIQQNTSGFAQAGQKLSNGGVLFNTNYDVTSIRSQLQTLVSSLVTNNGTSYNSLSSIGVQVDTTSQISAPTTGFTSASAANTIINNNSGLLAPLDSNKLAAALLANPNAVNSLINGSGGVVTQLASYLTGVTGTPTLLNSGIAGVIPSVSLLQSFENSNTDQITSLQQQIKQVNDSANLYADQLRKSFNQSEGQIAVYQQLQSSLASFLKG